MGRAQHITDLIQAEIEGTDYFIVGVKSNESESSIQVYIDSAHGVEIGFCARLSRKVSAVLDELEDETAYRFEISSPGADKPLVDFRQYVKHIGRELTVLAKDGSEVSGQLLSATDNNLLLERVLDKKKKLTETVTIDFNDVEHSTVKISFKSIKK